MPKYDMSKYDMNKDMKVFLILVGSLSFLFLTVAITAAIMDRKKNLSYGFSGAIDSVSYDVKGTPTILVKHNEYILSAGYNFERKIEAGDTLIKHKSSNLYKLIKHKTREVVEFTN